MTNHPTVDPPRVDHLYLDQTNPVQVRDHKDIVTDVMTMRDCSWPAAERYIAENEPETVEREILEKGRNSETWGGVQ